MIGIKGAFTQEAREELEKVSKKPALLLSGEGAPSRILNKEGILTLYALTK